MVVFRVLGFLVVAGGLSAQTPTGNPPNAPFQPLSLTDPSGNCKACHARQYFELKTGTMSGYRNVSPLFNGLEVSGNFITGGLLRPVYADSKKLLPNGQPFNTNNYTSPQYTNVLQAAAGFCYTCHQALNEKNGDDPDNRDVPEIDTGLSFRPDLLRPLRDYNIVDANGNRDLPATPGGPVPDGDGGGLGANGITCDTCHDTAGPDLRRSFQGDGFGNMSQLLNTTTEKVGQFLFAIAPANNFHVPSINQAKIDFLKTSASCNSCHDVRVPMVDLPGDLQHKESAINSGGNSVITYYRLENLSTEWQTGPLSTTMNPFGKVVHCQDCHTSLFPYTDNMTVQAGDMKVTMPKFGVFPMNYAASNGPITCKDRNGRAVGNPCLSPDAPQDPPMVNLDTTITTSTPGGFPLPLRQVSNHYFTGVDVPLMDFCDEASRIGSDLAPPGTAGGYQGVDADDTGLTDPCTGGDPTVSSSYQVGYDHGTKNEYGIPRTITDRRIALLNAAVRMTLRSTDQQASLGGTFTVRAEAVALTGHRFPAGLSQERTTYIQLSVTDANGFLLYQSGYQVDKPHPEMMEMAPDTNLDDEDLENVHASIDPGRHTAVYTPGPATNGGLNELYEAGPDDGPEERVYAGSEEGLVLFKNDLIRIFQPGESLGRNDAKGNPIIATTAHYEEVFSADVNNTVDNFRSLPPYQPRTFRYKIKLPTQDELSKMGVRIQGPLQVHAQINYEHFPPRLPRFVARTTGPDGPSGQDMGLMSEDQMDAYLRNVTNIASDDFTVFLK